MAFSVNWLHLVGRLGQDPEMRYTPEGHAVTRFSLATDRPARTGAESETDWHQVTCWRKLAEFAGEYLARGRLVAVTGHLTYRTWEGRDGQKRRTAEVVAHEWPAGRWTVLAGSLSVLESAELLRRATLYVGNDTGAMHLAAAVGTPCVAIFAAREPGRSWHPYGTSHVVLRHDAAPCANCYLTDCTTERLRCLTAIDVEAVWGACRVLLGARRAA